jgi:integrase/recombinase XerD
MTAMHDTVNDYLALRRKLGFSLHREGRLLPDLVDYLEAAGAAHLGAELALAWATQPDGVHPAWWRCRLGIARSFARYLKAIDPLTEVPPVDLLVACRRRVKPYLYSDSDIAALLAAAHALKPEYRAATYETLVGLLAITGLRLGEALGLDRGDVDLDAGLLVVRRAKRNNLREIPVHETTTEAMRAYAQARDRRWPEPETPSFFISMRGARLGKATVHDTFRGLVDRAGLKGRGERSRPRPHDLRHTMASNALLRWQRAGLDVETLLPWLSSYLGHVDPAATYWYLETVPELLAVTALRLESVMGDLR